MGAIRRLFSGRRWLMWACVALVLVGGGLGVSRNLSRETAPTEAGHTVAVTRGPISVTATGSGAVRAADRREVTAAVAGEVLQTHVALGDRVESGQLLVELRNDELELNLRRSRWELDRVRDELTELLNDRVDLKILAPRAGRLTGFALRPDQRVTDGGLLGQVVDDSSLEVTVGVRPDQLGYIREGDTVDVFLPSHLSSTPGSVDRINHSGFGTGDGVRHDVTVTLTNPGALAAGMTATIQFDTSDGRQAAFWSGVLRLAPGADIRAGLAGQVARVLVEDGAIVESGEVLAVLDEEALERAIATRRQEVGLLEAEAASLSRQWAETGVTAPIDGRVVSEPPEPGTILKAGTAICALADVTRMEVVIPVDELDIAMVAAGQSATVTAEALSDRAFDARVVRAALEGQSQGGVTTYDVTLEITRPQGLKPGMTVSAVIETAAKDDALLLPVEAVDYQDGDWVVWLPSGGMDGRGAPGEESRDRPAARPRPTRVTVGLHNASLVEILEGLQEGDLVLVRNSQPSTGRSRTMIGPVPLHTRSGSR